MVGTAWYDVILYGITWGVIYLMVVYVNVIFVTTALFVLVGLDRK